MKNKFKIGLLSMAVVGLVGCADKLTDEVVQSSGDIGGENGYISFRIKSADTGSMTRAWNDGTTNGMDKDYHKGDPAETDGEFAGEYEIVDNIQANRVFFFKSDGTYHSSSFLNLTQKNSASDDSHKDGYDSNEIVYSATVKRTSDRGEQNWPDQCLVILNGRPSRLNSLLARAQADPKFNMKDFLGWVNKDFRETDITGEGMTLGLYKSTSGPINGTDDESSDAKYYFTMTNSVFFDSKKDANDKNVVINATQIDVDENLKSTSDEAAKNPITVYVERIMSKVQAGFTDYESVIGTAVTESTENNIGYFGKETNGFLYKFSDAHETNSKWFEEEKKIEMKALITNWTINAVEYQTKLFKEIDKDWVVDNNNDQNDKPFAGWNDYSHHRSYWAIDPNYKWEEDRYPTQYRTAFDGSASTKSYEDNRVKYPNGENEWSYGESTEEEKNNDVQNENYPWALDYKSFNAVSSKRKYKYCLENTFEKYTPETEEGKKAPDYVYQNMIMGSHLLIQARLLKEDEYNQTDLDKITDKYYYSDRYYDEETYINRQLAVINEVLGENIGDLYVDNVHMWDDAAEPTSSESGHVGQYRFDNIEGGLWVEAAKDGKKIYKKVVAEIAEGKEDCQIAAKDVFGIAPAYVVRGDGKVTIALKGDDNGFGYGEQKVNLYYVKEKFVNENGQPVDEDGNDQKPEQFTRNQLVSLIYQVANTADCFHKGMMYYAVPIQHFIAGTHKGADKKPDGNYEYKYENIETGDYGVVRNHWYKFTINAIAKPGIPVHDPDQPIIPNYDMEDRYIGFEVVILPWHIVDNGNVTLGQ